MLQDGFSMRESGCPRGLYPLSPSSQVPCLSLKKCTPSLAHCSPGRNPEAAVVPRLATPLSCVFVFSPGCARGGPVSSDIPLVHAGNSASSTLCAPWPLPLLSLTFEQWGGFICGSIAYINLNKKKKKDLNQDGFPVALPIVLPPCHFFVQLLRQQEATAIQDPNGR